MSKKTTKQRLYFGGIPTEPDVKKIRERWPDDSLKVGQVITDEDMQNLILCDYGTSRFRTVTHAWRKALELAGILIGRERGVGFLVLNDSEKLDLQEGKVKTSVRAMKRSREIGTHVDRKKLTDEERTRQDFLDVKAANALLSLQTQSRAELPEW